MYLVRLKPEMPYLVLLISCFFGSKLHTQDFTWWSDNVGWDGKTHWRQYLTYSPRMLGPNALPLPTLHEGRIDSAFAFGTSGRLYLSPGDLTLAPGFFFRYATPDRRFSFDSYWVPREIFRTSHTWKTLRKVHFPAYGVGHAMADILFNGSVQLTRESKHFADLTFRTSWRYATSTRVDAARGTDAPGYAFDLTSGKSLTKSWRVFGMVGFYVWQTNRDDYPQNDAILLGLGTRIQAKKWSFSPQYRGYWGYIGDGDDHVTASLLVQYAGPSWRFFTHLHAGFEDNLYHSVELGLWFWKSSHP